MSTEAPVKTTDQEPRDVELTRTGQVYRPVVDILENRDELLIVADMPGAGPQDIDIRFEEGALTIHGRVKPRQKEDTVYLLREYGVGDLYRVFQVSESIDASRINAEYADGVLKLHLPRVEAVKPRKIQVQPK